MQLFPVGRVYDFMKHRVLFMGVSLILTIGSFVLLVTPGPKLGTDFLGGTELELAFEKEVFPGQIREAIEAAGFSRPDVIRVDDPKNPYRYLVRVEEVSQIDPAVVTAIERALCFGEGAATDCPQASEEVKVSPGGEKITVRFASSPDLSWVRQTLEKVSGIELQAGQGNPSLQNARDFRVEVLLQSKGDQLMDALRQHLPDGAVPERALRTEWIGPKAGLQLRDSAIKSIVLTLVFIMAYVAFRFDLRFAPGGVLALIHDAAVTLGVLTVLGKEVNLTTVAAILTIIGFSVNDTVVIYDRVRENFHRVRGASFAELVNVSLSETLSRTILTSGTVILVLVCFFVWGTGTLEDFALTLIIGFVLGVYSSIYVALPFTEWLDRRFFSNMKKPAKANARAA